MTTCDALYRLPTEGSATVSVITTLFTAKDNTTKLKAKLCPVYNIIDYATFY